MKYEFRKSASSKLILLVLTAVLNWHFWGAVFFKGYNLMGTGMMFLILCAFFGVFYIGLEGIMTLYRDLNSKQSYMLFLTPKSSYEILGAKILENGISILMAGAFFIVLAVFDLTVATLCIGGAKELMDRHKTDYGYKTEHQDSIRCSDPVRLCIPGQLDQYCCDRRYGSDSFGERACRQKGKRDRGICTVSDPFLAVQSDAEPGACI